MYIYVTKFSNYPSLIKIGKSAVPESRTKQLSTHHGDVIFSDVYLVGESYSNVERELHFKYAGKRVRDTAIGDGSTEFFCDSISLNVKEDLRKFSEGVPFTIEQLKRELQKEKVRYNQLMGRLFGRPGWSLYTGQPYELPAGHWDGIRILGCVETGFSKEEVFVKFVHNKITPNFTTVGRVRIAYHLFSNGSKHYNLLTQLIKDLE
jgi:hypothetical protein